MEDLKLEHNEIMRKEPEVLSLTSPILSVFNFDAVNVPDGGYFGIYLDISSNMSGAFVNKFQSQIIGEVIFFNLK